MTTHKAQGQTMERAIVDLEGCSGSEAPYVMLSRVKSLDRLLILHPFNKRKICCRQSEDTRIEEKRQSVLVQQTLVDNTTDAQQCSIALLELRTMLGIANIENIRASATMLDSSQESVTRVVSQVRRVQTEIEKIGDIIQRKRRITETQDVAANVSQESNISVIGNQAQCKKRRLELG